MDLYLNAYRSFFFAKAFLSFPFYVNSLIFIKCELTLPCSLNLGCAEQPVSMKKNVETQLSLRLMFFHCGW